MKLILKTSNILLIFTITLATIDTSAQVESDQNPCPSTILNAILEGNYDSIEFLLKYDTYPNVSLENCQGFERQLAEFPENISLLDAAALLALRSSRGSFGTPSMREVIYDLLASTASQQVQLTQNACPSEMLSAVFKRNSSMVESLLHRGADPNASLKACQDSWELIGFPEDSSLLHIAARLIPTAPGLFTSSSPEETIYNLLVSKGANQHLMDIRRETPYIIFEERTSRQTYSGLNLRSK